jgi:uncharacterized membrane protein
MDHSFQEQFLAFSKHIREELAGIRGHLDAIHNEQERQRQDQQKQWEMPPPLVRVEAETHEEPTTAKGTKSHHKQNLVVQSIVAISTCLAFIAAAIYANIASGQLEEMRKATKASADSAITAACALDENRKQFKKTIREIDKQIRAANRSAAAAEVANTEAQNALTVQTRPWVDIGIISVDIKDYGTPYPQYTATVNFRLENFGQSPALKVAYDFQQVAPIGPTRLESDDFCKNARNQSADHMQATDTIFPRQTPPLDRGIPILTGGAQQFEGITSAIGCVVYRQSNEGSIFYTRIRFSFEPKFKRAPDGSRKVWSENLRTVYVETQ